jgi:hypothetical protein
MSITSDTTTARGGLVDHLNAAAEAADQEATYRRPGPDDSPTHMHVLLADGTDFVVRRTNRDLIAWDRKRLFIKYGKANEVPFIFAAFLAWNAAQREGRFTGTFDGPGGFLDVAEDVTALLLAGEDGSDGEPRPTPTAAPHA